MVEMIKNDVVNIEGRTTLTNVPDSAKRLLRLMLARNPSQRIKAADCLSEKFFTEGTAESAEGAASPL